MGIILYGKCGVEGHAEKAKNPESWFWRNLSLLAGIKPGPSHLQPR